MDEWSSPRYLTEYERLIWEFEETLQAWADERHERISRDLGLVKRLGADAQGPRQQAPEGDAAASDGEAESAESEF